MPEESKPEIVTRDKKIQYTSHLELQYVLQTILMERNMVKLPYIFKQDLIIKTEN
jgi:hypothetical protein